MIQHLTMFNTKLKYVCSRQTGKAATGRYVGLEHVEPGTGKLVEGDVQPEGECIQFSPGDVLFGKLRPYLAKVALADFGGICSSEFLVLRSGASVVPRFLFFRLLSADLIDRVNAMTFGTKMPRADWDQIGHLEVELPAVEAQERICAQLAERLEQVGLLIAKKERLIELLEEKRAALISRAVTQGLDLSGPMKASGVEWLERVPAHWEERRLSELVRFVGGSTPSMDRLEYWDGEIPWVTPKDMKQPVIKDSLVRVTDAAVHSWGLTLVPPPAVLLVVRGMILAHSLPVALTTSAVTVNQDMKAMVCREIMPEYLMRWFQGAKHGHSALVEESAHGTRCFRTDLLKQVRIFVPPAAEQDKICGFVAEQEQKIAKMLAAVEKAIDLLREYRSALITAAVTGQLDLKKHERQMEALA